MLCLIIVRPLTPRKKNYFAYGDKHTREKPIQNASHMHIRDNYAETMPLLTFIMWQESKY